MKNLLVAQSGGPTAAINATLAGVIEAAGQNPDVQKIYGACYGIQGVLEEKFINLTGRVGTSEKLDMLSRTPAAALGSCRYKLKDPKEDDSEYQKIIDIFHKHNIGYFIYIGGNDSMDTVYKLSCYCREKEIDDIAVVGAPKTIDNDLFGIDHCPGFASAAKFIATVFCELGAEATVYDTKNVIIVEMMGRHAGWLTGAAALAENRNGNLPYLVYLEETPFDMERFLDDVRECLIDNRAVMVAVSEGVHDEDGVFICEKGGARQKDVFGHSQLAGTGKILEEAVRDEIGCKVRSIELNLLQRCASHSMSATDIAESRELGKNAVRLAVSGQSGQMSTLTRVEGVARYQVEYGGVDIALVANQEKKVPQEWINADRNGVTREFIDYLLPLIQGEISSCYENGIPKYLRLK